MDSPEQIRSRLHAEDFGDRIKAINQLRQLDPAVAFELIQPLTHDPNTRVRYAAISQVATLGQQEPETALKILRRALLEDPEADVQAAAADGLGALKLTSALDDLRQVYQSSGEWLVQMSIVACLGEMGDTRAFDLLEMALSSDNGLISVAAIGALGELGDARAVPLLLPYVADPDWQVRHRLAQALGQYLAEAEVKAALQKLAQDESEIVAEAAKNAL
ncbi:HEAT repeat domain-containing protein [Romeria aff. gracilis LEGE 07310]|uniref:HEAT repeat domain-containing protein n=1 Tax=Vasconcelosia minhoensis LEGE 07310 TaxID=915328 RepID=A0A8J7DMU4_9CYAN|nr:HEAT repeat domain-containing protein [Romeria gracilis]MBE9079371.1 HEAT repeat domain-containing protein [Romeria aff. gracilis LEGE 07310]